MSVHARGTSDDGEETTRPGPDAANRVRPARGVGADATNQGFSAQLRGVSLWDLVQMECLARSRLVVRVAGEGGVGYLYFDRGRVMHAATAHYVGEAAALEILSWSNGSFQPCERPWPERETIGTTHEALILHAAQLKDESENPSRNPRMGSEPPAVTAGEQSSSMRPANLVVFPGRSAPGPDEGVIEMEELNEEEEKEEEKKEGTVDMRGSNVKEAAPARAEVGGDFPVAMRLSPSGAVVSNRGGTEELAETVAYAQRLMQLAGDLLGIEQFVALECSFANGRCIIFTESNGDIVALRPRPEANLHALREKLGL